MSDNREEFSVERMAKVLGVSRSGYYSWIRRVESKRDTERRRFDIEVKVSYERGKGYYGRRRIKIDLKQRGIEASEKRIYMSMKRLGLRAKGKRKYRVTTNSKHQYPVCENLVNRRFRVDEPGKVVVSDITYIWSKSGWMYLVVFMDLFSRLIVGWGLSKRLSHDFVVKALLSAYFKGRLPKGCIIHSDCGVQYCSEGFRRELKRLGLVQSMSRKGDCYDNAVVESLWGTIKTEGPIERLTGELWKDEGVFFEYIEIEYNGCRIHSTLGMSPRQFESVNSEKFAQHNVHF